MAISVVSNESVMQMLEFIRYYRLVALPFEVIIPVIIWICAELKVRKEKKKQEGLGQNEEESAGESAEESPADAEQAGSVVAEEAGSQGDSSAASTARP